MNKCVSQLKNLVFTNVSNLILFGMHVQLASSHMKHKHLSIINYCLLTTLHAQ